MSDGGLDKGGDILKALADLVDKTKTPIGLCALAMGIFLIFGLILSQLGLDEHSKTILFIMLSCFVMVVLIIGMMFSWAKLVYSQRKYSARERE